MNYELLRQLGFSEQSAKVVSDFLGARVQVDDKRYTKPKPVRPTKTA